MRSNLSVTTIAVAVIFLIAIFGGQNQGLAQQSGDEQSKANSAQSQTIPLVGYIEEPEFLELANEIRAEFLTLRTLSADRSLAQAIVVYIGPNLVSQGRFVPPDDFYIPPDQLEILERKIFPEEGCRIERIFFSVNQSYIVQLFDASDAPSSQYNEQCLLLAVATALGENLDGRPVKSNEELRELIRGIVDLR
jgi:hypothetical protein